MGFAARPCQHCDNAHLSRNLRLSLRKHCACHTIYASGRQSAARAMQPDYQPNKVRRRPRKLTKQEARTCANGPKSEPVPKPFRDRPRKGVTTKAAFSRPLEKLRRRSLLFATSMPPPHAHACFSRAFIAFLILSVRRTTSQLVRTEVSSKRPLNIWPWVKIPYPPVNIPIPTRKGKNGWCTYPKMVPKWYHIFDPFPLTSFQQARHPACTAHR